MNFIDAPRYVLRMNRKSEVESLAVNLDATTSIEIHETSIKFYSNGSTYSSWKFVSKEDTLRAKTLLYQKLSLTLRSI